LCDVSFFTRHDGTLFAEYVDVDTGVPIFKQAIFQDTRMDIRQGYCWSRFGRAESLQTGKLYELIVVFADKQQYDR